MVFLVFYHIFTPREAIYKNKYLTVFKSINNPIMPIHKDNNIENINYKAAYNF